jgi:2,3,4,5-tetrahydropyridine-2,6-dicarboxylate N-succinyltransferase
MDKLKQKIIDIYQNYTEINDLEFMEIARDFINGLNLGTIRSAQKDNSNIWNANLWVKYGILLLFKKGKLMEMSIDENFKFFDKDTLTMHPIFIENNIRLVPGGSSIRTGSYIAPGVICMPPMYINIGAYVDEGTMIDSHALVGTCAQLGKRIHLSAGSQIGGVLEPAGARPVIIEDDVMIGGNCGVYEGTLIRKRAVLGSGVILTSSTKVYDLVNEKIIQSTKQHPLEIPEGAVVIPGSRRVKSDFGDEYGLSIASPIIIKYRDEKTDGRTALEESLR